MQLLEVLECAHVRPGDHLVLRVDELASEQELLDMRSVLDASGLDSSRVLIVAGPVEMVVVEGAP